MTFSDRYKQVKTLEEVTNEDDRRALECWEYLFPKSSLSLQLLDDSPVTFVHNEDHSQSQNWVTLENIESQEYGLYLLNPEKRREDDTVNICFQVGLNSRPRCDVNRRLVYCGPIYRVDQIREVYQSNQLKRMIHAGHSDSNRNSQLKTCYQSLTLLGRNTQENGNLNDHYDIDPDTLLQKLCSTHGSEPNGSSILFEGPAGVGKTTLFKHFAHCWSLKGDEINDISGILKRRFKWVVFIELHHIFALQSGKLDSVEKALGILWHKSILSQGHGCSTDGFEEVLGSVETMKYSLSKSGEPNRTLFLLDGLDEVKDNLSDKNSIACRILMHLGNKKVNVFVSSRYINETGMKGREGVNLTDKYFNRYAEVKGFTMSARADFVKDYAREFLPSEPEQETLVHTVLDALICNDRLSELSTNPLLLEAICFNVFSNRENSQKNPEDSQKTPIYKETIKRLLDTWAHTYNAHDHKEEMKESFKKLAADLDNEETGTKKLVTHSQLEKTCGNNFTTDDLGIKVGLLHIKESGDQPQRCYSFIHDSYWEYVLALKRVADLHCSSPDAANIVRSCMELLVHRLSDTFAEFFVHEFSLQFDSTHVGELLGQIYSALITGSTHTWGAFRKKPMCDLWNYFWKCALLY